MTVEVSGVESDVKENIKFHNERAFDSSRLRIEL